MPLYEGLGSGGEKTAVVLDLGEAFTKCGFAGETGPRCIIPSEIKKPDVSKVTHFTFTVCGMLCYRGNCQIFCLPLAVFHCVPAAAVKY
uniref:Actin-related protein 10-like n=1 Tax=Coturnix japonica TaxID=93934 RepID=A0A8C2Y8N6_COTJA